MRILRRLPKYPAIFRYDTYQNNDVLASYLFHKPKPHDPVIR